MPVVQSRPAALVRPRIFDNGGRRSGRRGLARPTANLTSMGRHYKWAAEDHRCPPTKICEELGLWLGCADYAVDVQWLRKKEVAR